MSPTDPYSATDRLDDALFQVTGPTRGAAISPAGVFFGASNYCAAWRSRA